MMESAGHHQAQRERGPLRLPRGTARKTRLRGSDTNHLGCRRCSDESNEE